MDEEENLLDLELPVELWATAPWTVLWVLLAAATPFLAYQQFGMSSASGVWPVAAAMAVTFVWRWATAPTRVVVRRDGDITILARHRTLRFTAGDVTGVSPLRRDRYVVKRRGPALWAGYRSILLWDPSGRLLSVLMELNSRG